MKLKELLITILTQLEFTHNPNNPIDTYPTKSNYRHIKTTEQIKEVFILLEHNAYINQPLIILCDTINTPNYKRYVTNFEIHTQQEIAQLYDPYIIKALSVLEIINDNYHVLPFPNNTCKGTHYHKGFYNLNFNNVTFIDKYQLHIFIKHYNALTIINKEKSICDD
jgi:hypothetical protein